MMTNDLKGVFQITDILISSLLFYFIHGFFNRTVKTGYFFPFFLLIVIDNLISLYLVRSLNLTLFTQQTDYFHINVVKCPFKYLISFLCRLKQKGSNF